MGKFVDLTGRVFARLTVVRRVEDHVTSGGYPCVVYLCRCACGTDEVKVRASALRSNNTKSCGCLQREAITATGRAAFIDLAGREFTRLTVIRRIENRIIGGKSCVQYLCQCRCGNQRRVMAADLTGEKVKSCGCLEVERRVQFANLMHEIGKRSGRDKVGSWKGDDVSYAGAHLRVEKLRGKASTHLCVDCSQPANEWSYDHSDPNERKHPTTGTRYSTDPARYSPRCWTCHFAFDHEPPTNMVDALIPPFPCYETVHLWLIRDYGKASEWMCVDCEAQATNWSYDGGCPDEMIQPARKHWSAPRRYTTNLDYYSPRCRSCHTRHDSRPIRLLLVV